MQMRSPVPAMPFIRIGHRYIMVMVEINANYIDAEPTKNRTEGEIGRAYIALLERIKADGL